MEGKEDLESSSLDQEFNPYQEPYPIWHETNVSNLDSILKQGILSGREAERPIQRLKSFFNHRRYFSNTNADYNLEYVSVANNLNPSEIGTPDIGLIIETERLQLIDPSNVDHGVEKTSYLYPKNFEKWVSKKIPPEAIKGIIIGEKPTKYYEGNQSFQEKSADPEEIIRIISQYKSHSNIPIYFKGERIWPK